MALFPYFNPTLSYSGEPSFGSNAVSAYGSPMQQLQWQNQRNLSKTMQALQPFTPLLSTDLVETDTDFRVHVDLPGVAQNDLDVTCTDGNLVIKAERKEVKESNTEFVSELCTETKTTDALIKLVLIMLCHIF